VIRIGLRIMSADLDQLARDVRAGRRGSQSAFVEALRRADAISSEVAAVLPLLRGGSLVEAVEVAARHGGPSVEAALRQVILEAASDPYTPVICAALGDFAVEDASIEVLRPLLSSSKSDVCCSALVAIGRIGGPRAAGICVDALGAAPWALRDYAAILVGINGTSSATSDVVAYAKKRVRRPRKLPMSPDALVYVYVFLGRVGSRDVLDAAWPSWSEDVWRVLTDEDRGLVAQLRSGREMAELDGVARGWIARRPSMWRDPEPSP